MDGSAARWEWRTFGNSFGEAEKRFAAMTSETIQDSDEIYLVSPAVDKSTKVRAGLLDIKSLEQVDKAGMERWRPIIKAKMPLSRLDMQRVCHILGASVPDSAKDGSTLDELAETLVRGGLRVRTVAVHKERRRFTVGGCMAEMTEVRTDTEDARTLAVESEDPGRVLSVVRELGLSHLRNTSYPRWLWTVADSGP